MFTFDDIKAILAADPMNLPDLHVHDAACWKSEPFVDSYSRIHMGVHQLDLLRNQFPCEFIRRLGPSTRLFRIKLDSHHLEGGVNDAVILPRGRKQKQQAIRGMTGQEREQ